MPANPFKKTAVMAKETALNKSPYALGSTARARSKTSNDPASPPLPSSAAVNTTEAPTQKNFTPATAAVTAVAISVLRNAP